MRNSRKGWLVKTYQMNEALIIAILKYLAERPYKEVAALISEIMKLRPIENKEKES